MVKNIFIAGKGKFASSLLASIPKVAALRQQAVTVAPWSEDISPVPDAVLVHAGSGRQLKALVTQASTTNAVVIQAATGITAAQLSPNLTGTVIEAPNLAIPIIKFLKLIKQGASLFTGGDVSIKESHQACKSSSPGTAVELANAFSLSSQDIISVRNPDEQLQLGVPKDFLNGHALHWIRIKELGVTLEFNTQVLGRSAYAHGVLAITAIAHQLQPRLYHVTELLELGLI